MATTALISDLHLGTSSGSDVLRSESVQDRLFAALDDCERLVLLGDVIELRDLPIGEAVDAARSFFERLGEAFAGREVVLVPGNHDHRLLGSWLERGRGPEAPAGLAELVEAPHPAVGSLRDWLGETRLEVRYPGIWVRDDVYATHGHYLDSHVTTPTIERLSVATLDRLGGIPTGHRATPRDYEQVHAPVYDLIFSLAQGTRSIGRERNGKSSSLRIWELIGGASGRARTLQGRLLGSALIPATLNGLERAGFGRFGRDFSSGEIGRAGVEAMHLVVERLAIEADHVIFGHIHRRGPLLSDDGRSASDPVWERNGVALHNTGNWTFVEGLMGRAEPSSTFWPGSMVVVGESGPPELRELLTEVGRGELAGPARPA